MWAEIVLQLLSSSEVIIFQAHMQCCGRPTIHELRIANSKTTLTDMKMIDNTNADKQTRLHWINLAKEFNIPIRLIRFTASSRLAEHNDTVRALNLGTVCTADLELGLLQRPESLILMFVFVPEHR